MFKNKIKIFLRKYAYQAVCYAENSLIGSGNGANKKEIAIDFLLSKLPLYLKPFVPLLKTVFNQIADELIELAVDKLHTAQAHLKEEK